MNCELRIAMVLFLALLSVHCKPSHKPQAVYDLLSDFPYAQQPGKEPAFSPGKITRHGKQYRAMIQNRPGNIQFHTLLGKKPLLSYSLFSSADTLQGFQVSIFLESDFPDMLKREYMAENGRNIKIDLLEFEGRIARITFQAKGPSQFAEPIHWVEPVIEQFFDKKRIVPDTNAFRARHRKDNVLIFLFDAANASHFGCYGYPKATTPAIDSIAAEGILFENAISQATYTLASVGSLFTGLYPDAHGVVVKPNRLPERFKTLAEYFREAGYETAMFSANPNVSSVFGYSQGFEHVRRRGLFSADQFVPLVNSWLDQVRDRRFFAYVHFREPHEPYSPPPKILARFLQGSNSQPPNLDSIDPSDNKAKQQVIAAYDANLAFADQQFGSILEHLQSLHVLGSTIIIVISDHGEAFWEHGERGHNNQVYEETVRIPLLVRFPGEPQFKAMRRPELIGIIDVMPTLVHLFQFSQSKAVFSGENILPLLLGNPQQSNRALLSQAAGQSLYALRTEEFKYICRTKGTSREELYFLSSDPQESANLAVRYPVLASYWRVRIRQKLEEFKRLRKVGPESKAAVDEETERELRSLGYVN